MSEKNATVCDLNEPLKVRISIQDFQRDMWAAKTKQQKIEVYHNHMSPLGYFTDDPALYWHARGKV